MGAPLVVEVVHVGDVLEVVGVQRAVLQGGVGGHIVVKLLDVQGVPVGLHQLLGNLQNGGVGSGSRADGHGLAACAAGIVAAGGVTAIAGVTAVVSRAAVAAAGGQSQDHGQG